ncbi:MAG: ABC transporter ATP-binding protein [Alphaproteobacteria bacterium]|nr:ABC transporter ATP-binding protein [Alphaproteobacteria bacterium]
MAKKSVKLSETFARHSAPFVLEEESSASEGTGIKREPSVFRAHKPRAGEGEILLTVQGLEKHYQQGGKTLHILQKLNLRLRGGEITALVGPSGSGKSTLLHILGLLDTPNDGQIIIGDQIVGKMRDKARTRLRNKSIGFVYQFHHLLPEFSALENVALPLIIGGVNLTEAKDRAEEYLRAMGLATRVKHRPTQLSGGEQQRVAIARALVNQPKLLFADEPTGNLDPETSHEVFEILLEQVRNRGIGALIATHNIALAEEMDRILELKGGKLVPY